MALGRASRGILRVRASAQVGTGRSVTIRFITNVEFSRSAGLRRQVVPAAGGIVLGYLAMTAVVAAGVGYLIAASPLALTVLTLVGGAYLVWLGIGMARHPVVGGADGGAPASRRAIIVRGMAVSGLNPKGLLIFVRTAV